MPLLWAVVPLRSFHEAKQRLASVLDDSARAALFRAMVQDVLTALTAVPELATAVITDDEEVCAEVARFGVRVLSEAELAVQPGLNGAVAGAARWVAAQGGAGMLVLHGDLPLLRADDLRAMLDAWRMLPGEQRVVLAPSADRDGTNGLLLSPPDGIGFHYGAGSFARHLAEAEQRAKVKVLSLAGVAADVDNPADLTRICQAAREGRCGAHTADVLNSLNIEARLAGAR